MDLCLLPPSRLRSPGVSAGCNRTPPEERAPHAEGNGFGMRGAASPGNVPPRSALLFLWLFPSSLSSRLLLHLGTCRPQQSLLSLPPGPSGPASELPTRIPRARGRPPDGWPAHLLTRTSSPERLTVQPLSELIRFPRAWPRLGSQRCFPATGQLSLPSECLQRRRVPRGQISPSARLRVRQLQCRTRIPVPGEAGDLGATPDGALSPGQGGTV